MAFGGGTFLTQNKILPGAYINFISVSKASTTVSDRGYGAMALELDWGPDDAIFTVEQEDFQLEPEKFFGYGYTADELKGLRDLFLNLKTGYFYRLNGGGAKATCDFGTAKYSGTRGNKIMIAIAANVDDTTKFDVSTYFDGELKDSQTGVSKAAELENNDFVVWEPTINLTVTAGTYMAGGTNGTAASGTDHSSFLALLESFSINTLGCLSTDDAVKALYYAYTKRMRDDEGAKFQLVVYDYSKANYEGTINVANKVMDKDTAESSLVYWVTGAEAGCAVNKTVGNKEYDGEYTVSCETKQSALKKQITNGQFAFHQINNDEVRVLKDINSFTEFTKQKTKDFSSNQVIRVLDQWANDVALIFDKTYLDKSQNIASGRVDLWNDLIDYAGKLVKLGAIQDFDSKDITVEQGEGKADVLVTSYINPAEAMEKLYMYTYVE